jgi:acetyl-CoA carboxylase biotin carboxyl carrier protein
MAARGGSEGTRRPRSASATPSKRGPAKKAPPKPNGASPAPADRQLDRLRQLVQILESSALASLEFEDADIMVRLSRTGHEVPSVLPVPMPVAPPPAASAAAPSASKVEDPNIHVLRSPFVGTFYRSPTPDNPPFTDVGQKVSKGQTLCIVEAMKLMNEIEAEVSGTVLEVLVQNGQAVQYHDPLFRIQIDR